MKKLLGGFAVLALICAALYGAVIYMLLKPTAPLKQGPTVALAQGDIQSGIDADIGDILHFNGIPFAAAPVGDMRWRTPGAAPHWDGVRDGREFGAECLQSREGSTEFVDDLVRGLGFGAVSRHLARMSVRYAPAPIESEDCLFLNVRTGNLGGTIPQPVMVWIHGGSHQTGAGSDQPYQDNNLVKNGVVQVTINYRLGPFGYLAHPALSEDDPRGVSGNYGLLDQIAALEWVQDNIAKFGGAPNNVTIFGESAGAQSVSEIMVTRLGDGLYHKAILQSGSSSYNSNGLTRAIDGRKTMHQAGVDFIGSLAQETASAADLRAISGEDLITQVNAQPKARDYFLPNVDGVVITGLIGNLIGRGDINAVPILAGYNADEGTLFYSGIKAPTVLKSPFPTDHSEQMAVLDDIYGTDDAAVLKTIYGLGDPATYDAGATAMLGDDLFGIHMRFLAKASTKAGAPAYLYHFTRKPPRPKQTLGAFHAAELFFVFDSHSPFFKLTDEDLALTEAMGRYWTNFAKTSNPNSADLPIWPSYDPAQDQWMTFNPSIEVVMGLRATKLDILERVLNERIDLAAADINPPVPTNLANSGNEEAGTDSLQP